MIGETEKPTACGMPIFGEGRWSEPLHQWFATKEERLKAEASHTTIPDSTVTMSNIYSDQLEIKTEPIVPSVPIIKPSTDESIDKEAGRPKSAEDLKTARKEYMKQYMKRKREERTANVK
jgi:hypothetical protein